MILLTLCARKLTGGTGTVQLLTIGNAGILATILRSLNGITRTFRTALAMVLDTGVLTDMRKGLEKSRLALINTVLIVSFGALKDIRLSVDLVGGNAEAVRRSFVVRARANVALPDVSANHARIQYQTARLAAGEIPALEHFTTFVSA